MDRTEGEDVPLYGSIRPVVEGSLGFFLYLRVFDPRGARLRDPRQSRDQSASMCIGGM